MPHWPHSYHGTSFRLIVLLLGGISLLSGFFILSIFIIDAPATREQERIFNEQQFLQTKLVGQALKDRIGYLLRDWKTISRISLPDYLNGGRGRLALEGLFDEQIRGRSDALALVFLTGDRGDSPRLEIARARDDSKGSGQAAIEEATASLAAAWGDLPGATEDRPLTFLRIDSKRQWIIQAMPVGKAPTLQAPSSRSWISPG